MLGLELFAAHPRAQPPPGVVDTAYARLAAIQRAPLGGLTAAGARDEFVLRCFKYFGESARPLGSGASWFVARHDRLAEGDQDFRARLGPERILDRGRDERGLGLPRGERAETIF